MPDLAPCRTCPWRRSSPCDGSEIPGFRLDLMQRLVNTVGRGFRPIMACHYTEPGEESSCRGYIARHGYSNLNVRMLAARGMLDFRGIIEACEELDLWPDFVMMLRAYEAAADG